MRKLLPLMVFLAFSIGAIAAPFPPPPVNDPITVPATLVKDPIENVQLGLFTAEFEKTTLNDIRENIGYGTIEHAGDASESIYWLCYSLPQQRMWLISHGEMGGLGHTLTQVSAEVASAAVETSSCPSLPPAYQPVRFDFGWVGSSKESIIGNLGQPSGIAENRLFFHYSGEQIIKFQKESVRFDVISFIEVKLGNGKVTSINVSHVTSN